jgi:hypothetical protein
MQWKVRKSIRRLIKSVRGWRKAKIGARWLDKKQKVWRNQIRLAIFPRFCKKKEFSCWGIRMENLRTWLLCTHQDF